MAAREDQDQDQDQDQDLDNTWVDSYKTAEQQYHDFYNEPVRAINVFSLYINTENTVVTIKREPLTLNNDSRLPREQLIALIKANQHVNTLKYKLFSLLRYNINLLPEEIPDFIAYNATDPHPHPHNSYSQRFLTPEAFIQDIYFVDTISIFQDLNALYLIFKEDERKKPIKNDKKTDAHKFTQKLKASIKKRYTRHKWNFLL